MEILPKYLGLLAASWGMLLRPQAHLQSIGGRPVLGVQITSVRWSCFEAHLYTLPTMLILMLPTQVFAYRQQQHRNFKWIFVLPYLLQCIRCYGNTIQNMVDLFTSPEMLAVDNYAPMHLKMIMIFGLQLLLVIELSFVLFYGLQNDPKNLQT
ncbi:hypothetical protein KR009_011731, partial [Drosophila setifemur]